MEAGRRDRVILVLPPRHGKSELASRRFPAWCLGRDPAKHIIAASYNSDLANDFGREVRNIIASPDYRTLFPGVELAADSRAANRWHTTQGGSYVAAGVGTAVTGRGADVLLIDDPLKDRVDADSEVMKTRLWEWYRSTAYTRLSPRGVVVVIETRWAEDDLVGRLLAEQGAGGDQWYVIELPAISPAGEALWPERYPIELLERIRTTLGPREWSALFQGQPAPEEGNFFLADWFRPYRETPPLATLGIYGASDYAVTNDGGDYTVHLIVGVDANGGLWLLDLWRGQTDTAAWIDAFCRLVKRWQPVEWAEEGGQIKGAVGPFIAQRQQEAGAFVYRRGFPSKADKAARAQSIRGRMAVSGLHVPELESWYPAFRHEVLTFPAARHDDQVDALGLFGQLLDHVQGGSAEKRTRKMRPISADAWMG